jgi:stage V sporulation protein G
MSLKIKPEIHLIKNPTNKAVAFANFVVNDSLVIKGGRIINGSNGPFYAPPSRQNKEGGYDDQVIPLSKEMRQQLQTAMVDAYKVKVQETSGGAPATNREQMPTEYASHASPDTW